MAVPVTVLAGVSRWQVGNLVGQTLLVYITFFAVVILSVLVGGT